jgi:hydroxyethylthiazole kinase-like uncharacterized protein yjeF
LITHAGYYRLAIDIFLGKNMLNLPYELYTAEQTRELDRLATEQYPISTAELMTRAGTAALNAIKQHWPKAKQLVIVCGSGNNGGDGFELATQALNQHYAVQVYHIAVGTMSQETQAAYDALLATGTQIHRFKDSLPCSDLIIDCLFGTGLNRKVSGLYQKAINTINQHPSPVLSADIPSGLHADTGAIMATAVNATVSLSLIGLNTGLFTHQGPDVTGTVCFDSLNIAPSLYEQVQASAIRTSLQQDGALLAPRPRSGHKGTFGHLLVIGGGQGMSGATRLASEAGARVGAGLISIATHPEHSNIVNLGRPCLMSHGVENIEQLSPLLARANVITLGPGLGQTDWAQALYQHTINTDLPIVLDADGLNLLSQHPQRKDNWVLTPHHGEAARLLGSSTAQVQANRFAAVQALQNKYGGVVVLKGAGTLIYNGSGQIRLSTFGNPGMGSGGMGDVLAGVIGGLIAQGLALMDAAVIGVTLHGMAGDRAAEKDGERGMLAMDLMPQLRHLANLN